MRIAVGAPVADRAEILPRWFECLRAQTIQPDDYIFIHSGDRDETYRILVENGARVTRTALPYYSRNERNLDPADPHRARHLARLRNQGRREFLLTDADVFFSLDTDILLEDPTVIERLLALLEDGWDTASPLLYLHPLGERSECYNAGWWKTRDPAGHGNFDFGRAWERATKNQVLSYRSPLKIDIPMAAVMMKRHALAMCRYQAHELGEDMGFAQQLEKHGMRCAWATDILVRHVMDPKALEVKVA